MQRDVRELIVFSKTLKVLLVEDNRGSREQATKLLLNIFGEITTGVDGVDGLEKFNTGEYDLIISDINMPNMDGIEMITKIREVDIDIPIIVLSAHSDKAYFEKTIKQGVDNYILKPINFKKFLDILYKTIEKIKLSYGE